MRLVLTAAFLSLILPRVSFAQTAVPWQTLERDLEYSRISLANSGLFDSPLTLLRTGLRRFRVAVISASEFGWQRATVRNICRAARATVCVNANFFDQDGEPLGLVISKGVVRHRLQQGGQTLTAVLQSTRRGVSIVPRAQFDGAAVLEAVQAGPRLVVNGAAVEGIRESEHTGRAGVCIDSQGRLVLFALSSGVRGLTLVQLQALLLSETVRCNDALNFDGGASAQLYVKHASGPESEALSVAGYDEVPVALALFPIGDDPANP